MKDWKKEFDEKWSYLMNPKVLKAFISKVEADACKKVEEDSIETAHNLMEIVVEKAYERAAKVADSRKCGKKEDHSFCDDCVISEDIADSIRSLKDD